MTPNLARPWSLLLASLLLAACTPLGMGVREQQQANQATAAPVIQAVARYQRDHGQLPANLAALVPGYLSTVPNTAAGAAFDYRLDVGYGYMLCFYEAGGCCYQHAFESWDCTKGHPE